MQLAVKASQEQQEEFLSKSIPANISIIWVKENIPEADAYFDLLVEEDGAAFSSVNNKPVFVNAVIETCKTLPANCIRINAWNGFLKRELIEVATNGTIKNEAEKILNNLQWKFEWVIDEPGMIAARIIAMIINEAYFGLGDEISSKEEIDIAMKLGTNYPYGPFEWSEKIGLKKIYDLLKKLSQTDSRYAVASKLKEAIHYL
jgi:3-hydroxybutyryl-CoA dehydrogenase